MTDKIPSAKQLARLPKWARSHIYDLQHDASDAREERDRLAAMLPWVAPGTDWFTLFCPPHRQDREIGIFTCDFGGTIKLTTLGRRDYLFVGRSKERDL